MATLVLYAVSASPEVHWQDAGQYELRVARGELDDSFGLCRDHPLHFWVSTAAARLLPITLPLAMSLVSALAGAISVANVFGIVRQWTGQTKAALLGAAGLLVGASFWQFSCIPGAHIISAAILTVEFWVLVNWDLTRRPVWLITVFLVNGMGLANHNLALLSSPIIGIVLLVALFRREAGWRTALLSGLVWLAGASMYLWLVIEHARADGLMTALHSAFVGSWGSAVAGQHLVLTYTATSVAFTLFSFPNLTLLAALLGVLRGRRMVTPLSYWALLAGLAMQLGFVLRYNVISQYAFLLGAYVLLAVFSGLGFAVVLRTWSPRSRSVAIALGTVLVFCTPGVYLATCAVTRHYHALGHWARNKPYRDDYRYLLIPWSRGEHSAQRMSLHAAELAGGDGLIIDPDSMGSWAVEYQLFSQGKAGVRVIPRPDPAEITKDFRSSQPVVFVPFSLDEPPSAPPVGKWRRVGDLYVLSASE